MASLPEDGRMQDIEAFFAERDFEILVHEEPPPEPYEDEWCGMSGTQRTTRRGVGWSHWADLRHVPSSERVRWYGGGMTPEEAIRRVRSRWRTEQGDSL